MNKFLLSGLILFLIIQVNAQVIEWASSFGDHTSDFGTTSVIDNNGDLIFTGHATGGTTFGNITINKSGIFVAKSDNQGDIKWVYVTDGSYSALPTGVVCDDNNDIIFTGHYTNGVTFDTITLPSAVQPKMYIAKLSGATGELVWVKAYGSSHVTNTTKAISITIDDNNNTYITGSFNRDLIVDTTTLESKIDDVYDRYDIFLLKMDNDGNPLWVRRAGGFNDDYAYDITTDGINILLTGIFSPDDTDFDTISIPSEISGSRGFIAKYDFNGNCQWIVYNEYIENGWPESLNIKTDSKGNIYTAGIYLNAFKFEDDTITAYDRNYYLLKLDNEGKKIYMRTFSKATYYSYMQGAWARKACELTIDNDESVFLAGDFRDTLYFRNDTLISTPTEYGWLSTDIVLAKYNEIGYPQWITSAGGSRSEINFGLSGISNSFFISGYFGSEEAIFGDTIIINNSGNMDDDIYLAKVVDTTIIDCPQINAVLTSEKLFTCGNDSLLINCISNYGSSYLWIINENDSIYNYSDEFWIKNSASIKVIVNPSTVCSDTSNTLLINNNQYPEIALSPSPTEILCTGDTCELSTTYDSTYSYQWFMDGVLINKGDSILNTINGGNYILKVGHDGCWKEDSVTITEKSKPELELITDSLVFYYYPHYFNAGWSDDYYEWTYNDDSTVISYDSSILIYNPGTYYVTLYNVCGYEFDSIYAYSHYDFINENELSFSIYPNPSNGLVTIEDTASREIIIKVYNLEGILVREIKTSLNQFDLSDLQNGEYIVKIISGNFTESKKLIIKN